MNRQRKEHTKTKENICVMTMVSRSPRQIVSFDAAYDKTAARIQRLVDSAPAAAKYCTDGYFVYIDVVYPGRHIRNVRDKKDTFTVEGGNDDLYHYIPILARRSRCFPRSINTLYAVIDVFAEAYNRFGVAKNKFRQFNPKREYTFSLIDFLY